MIESKNTVDVADLKYGTYIHAPEAGSVHPKNISATSVDLVRLVKFGEYV